MAKSRILMLVACLFIAVTLILQSDSASAQTGDCSAHVNVTQTSREQDAYGATFKYRIDATSDAASAVVHFKIRRTFEVNGSHYSEAEPWSVTLLDGHATDSGELRESSSPRQIQWSVEDVLCRKTVSSSAGRDSEGSSESTSDNADTTILGTWSGPGTTYFYRPRGQVWEGTVTLKIEGRTGPSTFNGTVIERGVRRASPGHHFDDGSTVAQADSTARVTFTVVGTSVSVSGVECTGDCGDKDDYSAPNVYQLSGKTLSIRDGSTHNNKNPGKVNVTLTNE
jgi:hypothetical protein